MKDVVASTRGADMPSRLESFRARCALALRFCAAAALGLAIVVGLSVVWSVAVFLQAIVGGEPTRPSLERSTSYFTSHRLGAAEGASQPKEPQVNVAARAWESNPQSPVQTDVSRLPEGSLAEHLREIAARRATKDVETASTFDLPFSIGDVVRGRASREPFVPA